jgi:hypothetical protein
MDEIVVGDTITAEVLYELREATKEFLTGRFPDGYTAKTPVVVQEEGPCLSVGYCSGQMIPIVEIAKGGLVRSGGWYFRIEGPLGVIMLNCDRATPKLLNSYWSYFVTAYANRRK